MSGEFARALAAGEMRWYGVSQNELWDEAEMKLPHRRKFLHLAVGTAALPAVSRIAWGQSYPSRPVRLVVGYPPGGTFDIVARMVGQRLAERLGQPVVVENKPGAGTNLAVQTVVRAPADGYTLLFFGASNTINTTFYEALPFDLLRDIAPVAGLAGFALVMEVNPLVPAKSVAEFIAYVKGNPGKVNMASFGVGGISHLAGELFKAMAGVDMVHVPYRGEVPALTDLISGRVQVMFDNLSASLPHIQSGGVRALAVTTATRSDVLRDVPTVGDTVPGYEVNGWAAVGVPKGTPAEIIGKLSMEINAILAETKVKAQLSELGSTPLIYSPTELSRFMATETEKWGKVVKFAGIRAE
jgi:tripartite-type tricarboxylate transporter receptor subunit TctC